jgi:hypothetical protein
MAISPYNTNAAGTVNITGGDSPYLSEQKQNQANTYDPFRDFLFNMLGTASGSPDAYVPEYTKNALQNLTQNPAVTPDNFAAIANPLRQSLQPGFEQEQQQLRDVLRKNGALGSGASAFETRRLIENQGNRANQLLASNYVSLTDQLARTQMGAINAGLQFPQANNNLVNTFANLAGSLNPNSVQTESVLGGSKSTAPSATISPTSNYIPFSKFNYGA